MPELPEVETIRRGLEKRVVGLTIKNLQVLNQKSVQFDPKDIERQKVLNLWRRAKILGINLTSDITLLFHLKMTGQLIFVGKEGERVEGGHPTADMKGKMPNRDTRAVFNFTNGSSLYFNDQIKFGWVKLAETSKLKDQEEIKKLGPEPLEKDFTWSVLKENLIKRKKMPVKVALMDQSLISGIGNIYASECLFLARVDPRRVIGTLSDGEFKKIHKGILKSLETSIKMGGSTIKNYVNAEGKAGEFLAFANVYGRGGLPCKRSLRDKSLKRSLRPNGLGGCKGIVKKITQAGRGTYFCPSCQQ